MKILFALTNLYPPQSFGGLRTSTDQLCIALSERGHRPIVLAEIRHGGLFAWRALAEMRLRKAFTGRKIACDRSLGYPVWRSWFPVEEIEYLANKEKPELIVVMGGRLVPVALSARATGIPVLVQIHDVDFKLHCGDFRDIVDLPLIANSSFTAGVFRRTFGIEPTMLYPLIMTSRYKTETTRESVTFINPVLSKGAEIALELARLCPTIPFSFIEGLSLSNEYGRDLRRRLSFLPNVRLFAPQPDMRRVYERCKILLVPSICDEAYGRVVTEAQVSGIPAVASARGGLPEAVGPGGILLDPNGPIDNWVMSIERLWNDSEYYQGFSRAASAYAGRAEFSYTSQVGAHERALLDVVATRGA